MCSTAVPDAAARAWPAGAASDLVFLSLHSWLGPFCFLVFALLALAAGIYVARVGGALHSLRLRYAMLGTLDSPCFPASCTPVPAAVGPVWHAPAVHACLPGSAVPERRMHAIAAPPLLLCALCTGGARDKGPDAAGDPRATQCRQPAATERGARRRAPRPAAAGRGALGACRRAAGLPRPGRLAAVAVGRMGAKQAIFMHCGGLFVQTVQRKARVHSERWKRGTCSLFLARRTRTTGTAGVQEALGISVCVGWARLPCCPPCSLCCSVPKKI